jgi:predicted anti-sigma-YlaC factor YlaD
MLTCRQVSELVSQSQDRPLGWKERWRLRAHLAACKACRNFQKQMSFLHTSFRNHPVIKDREDE